MIFETIYNIPGKDGRTIKEQNLELVHSIPIGTLVEVQSFECGEELAGARLFVTRHTRDCDGSPLYSIGLPGQHVESHGWSERIILVVPQ